MSDDKVTSEKCYAEIERLVSIGQWFGDATIARIANEWDLQCRHVAMIARRVIEAQSTPSRTFIGTEEQLLNDPVLAAMHHSGATEAEVIAVLVDLRNKMIDDATSKASQSLWPFTTKPTADQTSPLAHTHPDRR
jgi:hypothetical protein